VELMTRSHSRINNLTLLTLVRMIAKVTIGRFVILVTKVTRK